MREIKFRAWHKGKMITSQSRLLYSHGQWRVSFRQASRDYELLNGELMQFTGLKDKNGKEIYEGDVVKTEKKQQMIKWTDFDYATNDIVEWLQAGYAIETDPSSPNIEITGNIYENPELLK